MPLALAIGLSRNARSSSRQVRSDGALNLFLPMNADHCRFLAACAKAVASPIGRPSGSGVLRLLNVAAIARASTFICSLNQKDSSRGQGGGQFGDSRSGGRTHEGIDIAAPAGTPVVAALSGTVTAILPNPSNSYGSQVVINVGNNRYIQYSHLNAPKSVLFGDVIPGMQVVAGQQIGTVGRTGNLPSLADTHLHLEYRIGGPGPSAAVSNPLVILPMCIKN
jgi:murein DD-endopeptidase MepM/ murein hydrolase activator NlpD